MEEGEGAAADAKEEPRGRSRIHHGTGKKLVLFLDIIFLICPFQRVLRKRHEKSVLILVLIVFIFIVCHSFRLGVQTYQARYFLKKSEFKTLQQDKESKQTIISNGKCVKFLGCTAL